MLIEALGHKYAFKLSIECLQLICSCGFSNVYKPLKQGKELQYWIKHNTAWTYDYVAELFFKSSKKLNVKQSTIENYDKIMDDFGRYADIFLDITPYAPFRYAKEYNCNIKNKTILPIDECIAEYKKYLRFKTGV